MKFKYSTRFVIIFSNIVVKIPLSKRGYLQSINEKNIWDKYKGIAPLAELKCIYKGIVCQKRYKNVNYIPLRAVENIKKLIPEFMFDNCDLYNYKNWGIENYKHILLDYGINQHISTLYK
jgi:hypothetical protein